MNEISENKLPVNIDKWLLIKYLPEVGPVTFAALLEKFGSIDKILVAKYYEFEEIKGLNNKGFELRRHIDDFLNCQGEIYNKISKEVELLKSKDISVLTLASPNYPELLRETNGAPPILYYYGELKREDILSISVVGTRRYTESGQKIATRICSELASKNITIVSGMARGIDSIAHRGALEVSGRTIAVLGCGVDVIYPPENNELYDKIKATGCILSEYPPETQPLPEYFPSRNRIISGLTLGTLVVEAPERSGALITANYALEQNRTVFAIPGRPSDESSKGANRLIKQGAVLVEKAEDVICDLANLIESYQKRLSLDIKSGDFGDDTQKEVANDLIWDRVEIKKSINNLTEEEKCIYNVMGDDVILLDEISRKVSMPVHKVSRFLLQMEMFGYVKRQAGNAYIKV